MNRIKFVLSFLSLKVVLSFLVVDAFLAAWAYGCYTVPDMAVGTFLVVGIPVAMTALFLSARVVWDTLASVIHDIRSL
jgi:hypothetical protein